MKRESLARLVSARIVQRESAVTERQTVVQYRAPLVPPDQQGSLAQRDQQGRP